MALFLGQGQAEYNSKHFEQNPAQKIIKMVNMFIWIYIAIEKSY